MTSVSLSVFDCDLQIDCRDSRAESLIIANYGSLTGQINHPHLHFSVNRDESSGKYRLSRDELGTKIASGDGEFLFLLEKDLTIELQKLRRDLYFLHGAALEFAGRSILLVAPSGAGKSTTTWGLLHHGFRYLSDELAPVKLETLEVQPYPHAICLKKEPAKPYCLPHGTLCLAKTMHVPVDLVPSEACKEPAPLAAIFFLRRRGRSSKPTVESISKAKAAARLYANTLNALAHEAEGLDGAIAIARKTHCFELTIGDLSATCAQIKKTVQNLPKSSSDRTITVTRMSSPRQIAI
jgi:hypothetical protein